MSSQDAFKKTHSTGLSTSWDENQRVLVCDFAGHKRFHVNLSGEDLTGARRGVK